MFYNIHKATAWNHNDIRDKLDKINQFTNAENIISNADLKLKNLITFSSEVKFKELYKTIIIFNKQIESLQSVEAKKLGETITNLFLGRLLSYSRYKYYKEPYSIFDQSFFEWNREEILLKIKEGALLSSQFGTESEKTMYKELLTTYKLIHFMDYTNTRHLSFIRNLNSYVKQNPELKDKIQVFKDRYIFYQEEELDVFTENDTIILFTALALKSNVKIKQIYNDTI